MDVGGCPDYLDMPLVIILERGIFLMNVEANEEQIRVLPSAVPSLLAPVQIGDLSLPNRIVMSPMTRARSTKDISAD